MTLDELLKTIADSEAEDWSYITRPIFAQDINQVSGGGRDTPWIEVQEHDQLLVYRKDLRISIAVGLPHRDKFYEDWARGFPDPDASSDWVDFRYNGMPVYRDIRVLVDGARASLPVPAPSTDKVPRLQYTIWRLIDEVVGAGRFDEYFNGAGLTISDHNWPRGR
ncbi:hypothetical protein [Rhizobium leguminosarum]|uniref:hypothetical protein n=1 Tax=Rhizobium leguminosarum TaxID=384 RepID=UPI001C9668C9|nr:hypothetical protein [Rhizobium leguminosarum]MBY5374213.1 hypothetical protein [Rhizobium leguminosarum]